MRRRGISLFELSIAIVLLGVVLGGIAKILSAVVVQRRESERRLAAIQEAGNQMERLAALPWSELTEETAGKMQLSEEAATVLPEGTLSIQLSESSAAAEGSAPGRKVEVNVGWRNSAGQDVAPVRLIAWRHKREKSP